MDTFVYNFELIKDGLTHLGLTVKEVYGGINIGRTTLEKILKGEAVKATHANTLKPILELEDEAWLLHHCNPPIRFKDIQAQPFPKRETINKIRSKEDYDAFKLRHEDNPPGALKCTLKSIFDCGTIVAGIYDAEPLVSYKIVKGEIVPDGLFVSMLSEVAERNNLIVKWVLIPHGGFIEALNRGNIDLALGITATPEREALVTFAGRHFSTPLMAIGTRRFIKYGNLNHLIRSKEKLRFSQMRGSCSTDYYENYLHRTVQKYKHEEPIYTENGDTLPIFSHITSGVANITVASGEVCQKFMDSPLNKGDASYLFHRMPITIYQRGIAIANRQDEFRKWLSAECHRIFHSAAYKQSIDSTLALWRGVVSTKDNAEELNEPSEIDLLDNIQSKKTLRVATLQESYTANDEEGVSFGGFFCKLIEYICEKNGIRVQFEATRCSNIVKDVANNRCDVAIGIAETPLRRLDCDFCGLICSIGISAIYREDSFPDFSLKKLMKRKSLKCGAITGEIGNEFLENYHTSKHKPHRSEVDGMRMGIAPYLINRSFDCGFASSLNCKSMIAAYNKDLENAPANKKKISLSMSAPLALSRMGFMIPRGNLRFRNWLNSQVNKAIMEDGDMNNDYVQFLREHKGLVFDNMIYEA